MPRKTVRVPAATGAVTHLCACSRRIQRAMACCGPCWKTLPPPLQRDWLAARDGDCDSGAALEAAATAIRDYLAAKAGEAP